jgi:hypothetical protein
MSYTEAIAEAARQYIAAYDSTHHKQKAKELLRRLAWFVNAEKYGWDLTIHQPPGD